MEEKDLKKVLEEYLYALKLPTFVKNYQVFAQDAARSGQSYERFLFGLAKEEFIKQEADRVERAIARAKFPVLKEIASFDFSVVGGITKQRVVELTQGDYLTKKESIILVGNPGLGKTHIATGLGMAACRQGKRVRFYGAASVVNEMLVAQKELRLTRMLAQLRKLDVLILDELGFIPFSKDGAHLLFQM